MIDNLLGRPSESWRRTQVILVIIFWTWRLIKGNPNGLRFWYIKSINRRLKRFTPYQVIVATLTTLYALRNFDVLLGLQAPEPLAHLYSKSYYRATWLSNALDAGFATAMSIVKPQWLKDIAGPIFGFYYLFWTEEAEEKLRKFRASCTVEFLRVTGEKLSNPYVRAVTFFSRPRCKTIKEILLPRPKYSKYTKPISCLLFFDGSKEELESCSELVIDFPGGAFVFMTPKDHEERLRWWAKDTKRAILSVNYCKSPEHPFPFAIDESFDLYKVVTETNGRLLDMKSGKLNVLLSGDSAGGNIVTAVMLKILESSENIKRPVGIVLTYPALDFNFTSWMSKDNLETLRSEQSSSNLSAISESKENQSTRSPLSVSCENSTSMNRRKSWSDHLSSWTSSTSLSNYAPKSPKIPQSAGAQIASANVMNMPSKSDQSYKEEEVSPKRRRVLSFIEPRNKNLDDISADIKPSSTVISSESESDNDNDSYDNYVNTSLYERAMYETDDEGRNYLQIELQKQHNKANEIIKKKKKLPIGTRLTMTSRSGFFNDRIIPPSVMRACALLYIGPKNRPDFDNNYYLSPILAPLHLLEQFPTTLIVCGERDPFVDDSLIFAGRLRKSKQARQADAIAREAAYLKKKEGAGLGSNVPKNDDDVYVEDPIINEDEDDWVHLRIVEGMSHGFMQMTAVVSESLLIVKKMGQWIEESFLNANENETKNDELKKQLSNDKKGRPRKSSEGEYELSEPLTFTIKKGSTLNKEKEVQSILSEPTTTIHTPTRDQDVIRARARLPKQIRMHSTPPSTIINRKDNNYLDPLNQRRTSFDSANSSKDKHDYLLVSEAEVLRRRRAEAVMGMGEVKSAIPSDEE